MIATAEIRAIGNLIAQHGKTDEEARQWVAWLDSATIKAIRDREEGYSGDEGPTTLYPEWLEQIAVERDAATASTGSTN